MFAPSATTLPFTVRKAFVPTAVTVEPPATVRLAADAAFVISTDFDGPPITTASPAPGTAAGLQFAGTCQLWLAAPTQVIVSASTPGGSVKVATKRMQLAIVGVFMGVLFRVLASCSIANLAG
jgi:hypothetical protein